MEAIPLATFPLSHRLKRVLRQLQIATVNDACSVSEGEYLSTPGFGVRALKELREVLAPFINANDVLPGGDLHQSNLLCSPALEPLSAKIDLSLVKEEKEAVWPMVSAIIDCLRTPLAEATRDWNLAPATIRNYADHLMQAAWDLSHGKPIRAIDEVAVLIESLKDRQKQVVEYRYGIQDGTERTLDEIGERLHVSRERSRQILKTAEDQLAVYRPPLPLIRHILSQLPANGAPVPVETWVRRFPIELGVRSTELVNVIHALQRWKWVDPLTTYENDSRLYVAVGAGRESEIQKHVRATRRPLYLLRQLVAVSKDEVIRRSALEPAETLTFLESLGAKLLHQKWLVWPTGRRSWLRTRVGQMLKELGPLTVATTYKGLKRQSTFWRRMGSPCPPTPIMWQALRRCGYVVDQHGIIESAGLEGVPSLSKAERLVIDTLRESTRPLTIAETMRKVTEKGGKESMALFFLGQSPLVEQVERGIFAIRGRSFAEADKESARRQKNLDGIASISGELVTTTNNEVHLRFPLAQAHIRALYIPQNVIPEGDWILLLENGSTRQVQVRSNYLTGVLDVFRGLLAHGHKEVGLRFVLSARACEMILHQRSDFII